MKIRSDLEVSETRLADLCRAHRVRELALFGSALGERFRPDSDIDLLVEFEPGAAVGFLALSRLQRDLSDLFGRTVDLVPKSGLKPSIRGEIVARARTLYAA